MSRLSEPLDVKNLCSRKLLELARKGARNSFERLVIERELRERRHYLQELSQLPQATRH